jgi:hypothetical protein
MSLNNIELESKVKSLVHSLKYEKGYVCSIDVLLKLEYLTKKNYEDWRFGRIECLEKVCGVNLSKLSLINKLIRKFSAELNLDKSLTAYFKYGKGAKSKLFFSKSRNNHIEVVYSTHYLDKKRIADLKIKEV